MKTVTIILIGLLILGLVISVYYFNKEDKVEDKQPQQYQGPVRPTDDEEHFRKTGETKPLEIKE